MKYVLGVSGAASPRGQDNRKDREQRAEQKPTNQEEALTIAIAAVARIERADPAIS